MAEQSIQTNQQQSISGLGIAGLVLGAVALVFSLIPIVNNVAAFIAVLGLIFGIIGAVGIFKGKKRNKVIAILALVFNVVALILVFVSQGIYGQAINNALDAGKSNTAATQQQNVPTEYSSALSKAESYSKTMHMSKKAIYDQLTSSAGEKFSADAAQYAVDNLQADYKANALEKAKNYQNTMHMSKKAIYDQLTSSVAEKFTAEEAQYAIDNLGN